LVTSKNWIPATSYGEFLSWRDNRSNLFIEGSSINAIPERGFIFVHAIELTGRRRLPHANRPR
jgi:hypothetical protein